MDLVTRKWLATIVSVEETSTQVQAVFTDALEAEGLVDEALERGSGGLIDPTVDDERRPILLAVSDNGGADDVGVHAGVHGDVRDRVALRTPRHADRSGLDLDAVRASQGGLERARVEASLTIASTSAGAWRL
jgi:hypothetical protein